MARRIVTGNNPQGRSYIVSDELIQRVADSPDGVLWRETGAAPEGQDAAPVLPSTAADLEPPHGGSRCSLVHLPPWKDQQADVAAGRYPGLDPNGFHRTRSIDYVMIISGEVELLVDDGQVTVRAGDLVVQRNANHAWRNLGDSDVVFWGVMHAFVRE